MKDVAIVGIDLAKNVFQLHGATAAGEVLFRRKLTRARFMAFVASLPPCIVAMEACAGAHYWGRLFGAQGHEVRLIPPIYVKPFLKRQKNDAADAEAIVEAALRPTMRFVAVKTVEKQACAMAFKTRDLLVRQRTQTINALRGHLTEHGVVVPIGLQNLPRLDAAVRDEELLPDEVRVFCDELLSHVADLSRRIAALDKRLRAQAHADELASRLMAIPGIGPICASAIEALAPPASTFRKGRDFAAWIGLVPSQTSSGGKERLGQISKMGQRDLRRLLVIGASSVVRWVRTRGTARDGWLSRMLARKPLQVVIVALANRMARIAWALIATGTSYRPAASPIS